MENSINTERKKFTENGVNPLVNGSWHDDMQLTNLTLDWVYGQPRESFNFDPVITDKSGQKFHYQRGLCWTLQDKQNFIDSIYLGINCGYVVLKTNEYDKFCETGYEYDVVDGKQRINCLMDFFENKFPDSNGNYWKDFSKPAQRFFKGRNCITFCFLRENCSDEKVKRAFLNVNFTGVPMSKEHIEFVKSINL
jgi:uncharacterized protein with ParB-like and HNH nuclease domain